jgi:hypothetical protein
MAKSNVTKEEFFEAVKETMNSKLTDDVLESGKKYKLPSISFGMTPFRIKGKQHYAGNLIGDILRNSYGLESVYKGCKKGAAHRNEINQWFAFIDDMNSYYLHKHYCESYGQSARACRRMPKSKDLLLNDQGIVDYFKEACPQVLSLYQDYDAFVDKLFKGITTKKQAVEVVPRTAVVIEKKPEKREPISKSVAKNQNQAGSQTAPSQNRTDFEWRVIGIQNNQQYQQWVSHGFVTYGEIKSWKSFGSPAEAKPWKDAGFDVEEAGEWSGFSFEEAQKLKTLEIPPHVAKYQWKSKGFSFQEIVKWTELKCDDRTAQQWKRNGFSVDEAKEWIKSGFGINGSSNARNWKKGSFSPEKAKTWLQVGYTQRDSVPSDWKKGGITPKVAIAWKKAGFSNYGKGNEKRDAKPWIKANIPPAKASQWVNARVDVTKAIKYNKIGIQPTDTDRIEWENLTSDLSKTDKKKWESTGYSFPYLTKLINFKVTVKDLPSIKNSCPNQIDFGSKGHFAVQDPNEVKGKCYYFFGPRYQNPKGNEALFYVGQQKKQFVLLAFGGKVPKFVQAIVKGKGPVEISVSGSAQKDIPSGSIVFIKFQK